MRSKAVIRISGVVQGVGFRPFIYRTARKLGVQGYVKNLGDAGVEVLAEGSLEEFIEEIKKNKPPNARIDRIEKEPYGSNISSGFRIMESGGSGIGGKIPPDFGICDSCVSELFSKKDKRHRYALITCTDCGPRFSTLKHVPVDRANTSFHDFPPCQRCVKEFDDPENRRFFAQTIACEDCGPNYRLLDGNRKEIKDPIKAAVEKLLQGRILAIKGVGGMHLACLTSRDDVVAGLRERLKRPEQPFAIMSPLNLVDSFACSSREEGKLLCSRERPIVVLKKKKEGKLSSLIAPKLHNVGVILPYTGLHHLLFEKIKEPLVMTSANFHGEPMIIQDDDIYRNAVADYYLLHNLEIMNRCDDSVVKMVNDGPAFIRRSRGFVPAAIEVLKGKNVLAFGPEMNATFCLVKDGSAFLSQHIGNTERLATIDFMEKTIGRFLEMIPSKIDVVACDLHPSFNTTRLAERFAKDNDIPLMRVQHHISHIASLLVEHGLDEIIGVCCDGVGFGLDGKPWGGEVFSYDGEFKRVGHLKEQPMPGGDLATRYPARMVAGILYGGLSAAELSDVLEPLYFRHGPKEINVVLQQLEKGINVQHTSSTGRVLDSISCLLRVSDYRSYEGEPAIKLESAAVGGKLLEFPIQVENNVLDTSAIVLRVLELKDREKVNDIAFSAQHALARGVAEIAIQAAQDQGIPTVGFSGGVAYNDLITQTVALEVKKAGLGFVQNELVPCGDGGVSFGQASYALLNGWGRLL